MSGKNNMPKLTELQAILQNNQEDFLLEMLTKMLKRMMELEISEQNKAERYERTAGRKAYRNGSRERTLST